MKLIPASMLRSANDEIGATPEEPVHRSGSAPDFGSQAVQSLANTRACDSCLRARVQKHSQGGIGSDYYAYARPSPLLRAIKGDPSSNSAQDYISHTTISITLRKWLTLSRLCHALCASEAKAAAPGSPPDATVPLSDHSRPCNKPGAARTVRRSGVRDFHEFDETSISCCETSTTGISNSRNALDKERG